MSKKIFDEDTKKWHDTETMYVPFVTFRKLGIYKDGEQEEIDLTTINNGCIGVLLVFDNIQNAIAACPDTDVIPLVTIADDYYR